MHDREFEFRSADSTICFITLFCSVYVNHRPAFGLSPDDLHKAFEILGMRLDGDEPAVDRGTLLSVLQRKGMQIFFLNEV